MWGNHGRAEQSIRDLEWRLAETKNPMTHFDYSEERHMTTKEEVILSAHSHLWIYGHICTTRHPYLGTDVRPQTR